MGEYTMSPNFIGYLNICVDRPSHGSDHMVALLSIDDLFPKSLITTHLHHEAIPCH